MVTVKALLAVAIVKKCKLHQIDVHNGFLYDDLDAKVYMQLPLGFSTKDSTKMWKLKKVLYGLQQTPCYWLSKLATSLKKFRFVQSYFCYSLFTYCENDIHLSALIYVDDLIIARNNFQAIA